MGIHSNEKKRGSLGIPQKEFIQIKPAYPF